MVQQAGNTSTGHGVSRTSTETHLGSSGPQSYGAPVTAGTRPAFVTFALVAFALTAFAGNSVLCRLALGNESIDPWSFTAIRLGAGALALLALTVRRSRAVTLTASRRAGWKRAAYLVLYALPFSLAYVALDTGTGALLLFGSVQLTMLALGILAGERPRPLEWLALFGAAGGVVYLVLPGWSAPDPFAAALMLAAGVGWGFYTVAGRNGGRGADPAVTTADAFRRAAMIVIPATAIALPYLSITPRGVGLATISGALTSGIGYAIWYAALRHVSTTRAALVQLSVPVLAAIGGVVFLSEAITARLSIASLIILGSIAAGVAGRRRDSSRLGSS